jgi:hypothetical protein
VGRPRTIIFFGGGDALLKVWRSGVGALARVVLASRGVDLGPSERWGAWGWMLEPGRSVLWVGGGTRWLLDGGGSCLTSVREMR